MYKSVRDIYNDFQLLNKALGRKEPGPACEFLSANIDRQDIDAVREELLLDPIAGPMTIFEVVRYVDRFVTPDEVAEIRKHYIDVLVTHKWSDAGKAAELILRTCKDRLDSGPLRVLTQYVGAYHINPQSLVQSKAQRFELPEGVNKETLQQQFSDGSITPTDPEQPLI